MSTLAQKGIIEYEDLIKPLSRRYIASKLIDARVNFIHLTSLQQNELEFYEKEFGYEIEKQKSDLPAMAGFRIQKSETRGQRPDLLAQPSPVNMAESSIQYPESISNNQDSTQQEQKKRDLLDKSWEFEVRSPQGEITSAESVLKKEEVHETSNDNFTFFSKDNYDRYRFFNFTNDLTYLNIRPTVGYESGTWEKDNFTNMFLGLRFHGEIGDIIGYNFELKHTRQSPPISNSLYNNFSKNTSIDLQLRNAERLEYSTVNVDLGVNWDWGSFTVGKNHLNWGYGESGKIVLSEKAPSFPYIRLDLKPTEWFRFNYLHAWLNSDVIDSNSFYSTLRYEQYSNTDRYTYIPKYLALHSVTFIPIEGLELSMGESVIYSDNLQISYLIPIMFFDLADEYLNRNDNYAGASTQLFLALSSRNHLKNTHLYANFHADELTPEALFDVATQYYKMAFTIGGSVIDLPIDNLGLTLEYTKVYPGNYRHFIPTLTYESSSSLMGHWMGDNGDLFYAALDYTFLRGLKVKVWTQHIRKGTEALGNRAYKVTIPQPHFLFTDRIGDRKNYSYYGINAEYEILHDLWVKAHFQYIDFERRIALGEYKSTLYRDFSFSLGYGI